METRGKMCVMLLANLLMTGLLFSPSLSLAANEPVIYYTDITSGPNTGGQDNRGAFVRIFGKNFGATRNTSTVSIGGGAADNYPVWSDTEIVVQLGANARTGNIIVTTPAGISNGIVFTVRSGNIYFVNATSPNDPGSGAYSDPWRSPRSCVTAMSEGDICYIRQGTYNGQYDGAWPANFDLSSARGGTASAPIAYVGYPGELPLFTGYSRVIGWHNTWKTIMHLVFANFEATPTGVFVLNINAGDLYGENTGAEDLRFVNIKVHGIANVGATGIFKLAGNNNVCLGNEIYGNAAPTAQNLAHSFYPSNGLDNLVIAYNYMHDNDWGSNGGYEISVHTDGINTSTNHTINAQIYNNRISVGSGNIRGIGVGNVGNNSTIYIHNNEIDVNWFAAVFIGGGYVYLYHNTLYCNDPDITACILFNGPSAYPGPQGGEITNNTIYSVNRYYPTTNTYLNNMTNVNTNIYYGAGALSSANGGGAYTKEVNPKNIDPGFANAAAGEFTLRSDSLARNAGIPVTKLGIRRDKGGRLRPASPSIGAHEYDSGITFPKAPSAR